MGGIIAAVGLCGVEPSGVMGKEKPVEAVVLFHVEDEMDEFGGLFFPAPEGIEGYPGAHEGCLDMFHGILFIVGVGPDESIGGHALLFQDFQLLEGTGGRPCVGHDSQSGRFMGECSGSGQCSVKVGERFTFHSNFDEPGVAVCSFNAIFRFVNPETGHLFCRHHFHFCRDEFVVHCTVVPGIGDEVQAS